MSERSRPLRSIAPPTEGIEVVSVRLTQDVKARVARIAQDQERSVSWMLRRMIEQSVRAYEANVRASE